VVGSLIYSLLRALLDALATSHGDQAELQAEVLALRRQVQVLERQIKRVRWSAGDRMVLAALRERIPRSGWAGLLVKPGTVLGWHRALVRRKWAAYRGRPRRGRPPISAECRQLIVWMSGENPGWGYFRIRGELLKLGHQVAATTIRSVLLAAGIPPSGRRSQLTWKRFLTAHAETLVAADFFSVFTILFKRLYVLIYVHLASRRVLLAICTSQPKGGRIEVVQSALGQQLGLSAIWSRVFCLAPQRCHLCPSFWPQARTSPKSCSNAGSNPGGIRRHVAASGGLKPRTG
jgi:putative transposase